MTVLQQYAQEQDVWRGKPGETYVCIINPYTVYHGAQIYHLLCYVHTSILVATGYHYMSSGYCYSIPPLTGAIAADEKHKCKPEDQVKPIVLHISMAGIKFSTLILSFII